MKKSSDILFCIAIVTGVLAINWFIGHIVEKREEAVRMQPVEVKRGVEAFILVSQTTPKHYYVTLKSKDGRVYEHQYVSKHCNKHRDNVPGETYNIETSIMYNPKTKQQYLRFNQLYRTFCE